MMLGRVTNPSAGGGARILAFALDYVLIMGYMAFLAVLSVVIGSQELFSNPARAQLSGFLMLVLPVVLYFGVSEWSVWQGT